MSSSKNQPVEGLFGRCLSEFMDWRYIQSCWYFRHRFLNCCPSNLLFGSTPPSPLPCVYKCTGNGKGGGLGISWYEKRTSQNLNINMYVPYRGSHWWYRHGILRCGHSGHLERGRQPRVLQQLCGYQQQYQQQQQQQQLQLRAAHHCCNNRRAFVVW